MTNPMYWTHAPSRPKAGVLRRAAAAVLRAASATLNQLAHRLTTIEHVAIPQAPAAVPHLPVVEFQAFHSDAGAPEGALYVDGVLVGYVPGVARL